MWRGLRLLIVPALIFAQPAVAHVIEDHPTVVIDTDMGLDDAVALAMALQHPRVSIVAIVACEGVAGREKGVQNLERMLDAFNRKEIPLYAPVDTELKREPPPFRAFAEEAIGRALPERTTSFHRPFAPDAYVAEGKKTVVLMLGPLTNLAAALQQKPDIKQRIAEVIVAGSPEVSDSWNAGYDPDALAVVKASGIPLEFVVPGAAGRKPESWREGNRAFGQGTSVGEGFIKRLLADSQVRTHYVEQFERFHDELVFLYYADSALFLPSGDANVFTPANHDGVIDLFTRFISCGRQRKARVVFVEGTLPDRILREDLRERKARIIAKNGEDEWFAQLLMNELHEHLGAYSVIGVKMGLRAAGLLNAPQHGIKVVSHTAAHPPVSCLNDGIIVSTGSTPGRGLFSHVPGPSGSTKVAFTYNGRRITLALKDEYRRRVAEGIKALSEKPVLPGGDYWDGVRRLGLDIWENWHRRDLFEMVDTADDSEK
jgi:inosine-uridine nucleoside N-ribohydrolase